MKGWLVRACLTAHIPRATEYGLEGDSERTRGRKREKCAASPNKGGREWEESNPRCCRGPSGGRRLRAAIACCLPILEILKPFSRIQQLDSLRLPWPVILASCYTSRFDLSQNDRGHDWNALTPRFDHQLCHDVD